MIVFSLFFQYFETILYQRERESITYTFPDYGIIWKYLQSSQPMTGLPFHYQFIIPLTTSALISFKTGCLLSLALVTVTEFPLSP